MRILIQQINGVVRRSIDIRFAQLLDHTAYRDEVAGENKEFSLDDLSLVKNDDLEEMVAIDAMINKANEQQDQPELVVHLDRHRSHGVFDARPFDARIEPVAHLVLVVAVELPAQEGGDVVRFYGVNRGPSSQ